MIPTRIEHAAPVPAIPHVSRISAPYRPIVEIDADYSQLPIEAGFNWSEAFADVDYGAWYLVVFRSRHRPDADDAYLTWLDERASHAASQHPGFLYYFIGTPRPDGCCLSFCLWHSRQDAVVAATDPEHQEAMLKSCRFSSTIASTGTRCASGTETSCSFHCPSQFRHRSQPPLSIPVLPDVGFGLSIRKRPKTEIRQRVDELLSLVQRAGFA